MNKLEINNSIFEGIKHIDEFGNEYWLARELMPIFGYIKWQKFKNVINKAMIACKNSNHNAQYHFTGAGKMIKIAKECLRSFCRRWQNDRNC